jgi:hypothetical protein
MFDSGYFSSTYWVSGYWVSVSTIQFSCYFDFHLVKVDTSKLFTKPNFSQEEVQRIPGSFQELSLPLKRVSNVED